MVVSSVPATKRNSWLAVFVVSLFAITIGGVLYYFAPSANTNNQVVLEAPFEGQQVQMFANPGSGADSFADFPDGTACTRLDGPIRADFGSGLTSDYYQLTCNDVTGYVNAKWVSMR